MSITTHLRRFAVAIVAAGALSLGVLSASVVTGSLAPAVAQASEEFQIALEPYGQWRPHPRFGEVWVPARVPPEWRPYEYGHWVYTDEWGWYWVSDDQEADWGWVTYHYGRWAFEQGFGWYWVPGDEWAPAWVDWRSGDDYVGWAPLPPDEFIGVYDEEPAYWVFVAPRFLTAPRLGPYIVRRDRWATAFRGTRLVNRTVVVRGPGRIAINAGLPPAYVARVTRAPLPTYRVQPRVLPVTRGVAGAVVVRRDDLRVRPGAPPVRRPPVVIQRTTTVVQPSTTVVVPPPLNKGDPGRVGPRVPRAAQGGVAPVQPRPAAPPPAGAAPAAPPPAAPPPAAAPRPAAPPPGAAPQVRPQRPVTPQTPPPAAAPPPAAPPPAAAPRPNVVRPAAPPAPPVVRPAPPPPPAVRSPPPVVRPAPPPAARPAPPAARPAPPPPAARPAPPPQRPAAPPPRKPGEKPEDKK